jgi:hypothetical protein
MQTVARGRLRSSCTYHASTGSLGRLRLCTSCITQSCWTTGSYICEQEDQNLRVSRRIASPQPAFTKTSFRATPDCRYPNTSVTHLHSSRSQRTPRVLRNSLRYHHSSYSNLPLYLLPNVDRGPCLSIPKWICCSLSRVPSLLSSLSLYPNSSFPSANRSVAKAQKSAMSSPKS